MMEKSYLEKFVLVVMIIGIVVHVWGCSDDAKHDNSTFTETGDENEGDGDREDSEVDVEEYGSTEGEDSVLDNRQAAGEVCNSRITPNAGECGNGMLCIGLDPKYMEATARDECTTAEDCRVDKYFAGIVCVEVEGEGKFCGSSFCAPYCDRNNSCEHVEDTRYIWEPMIFSGLCFCMPKPRQ